MLGKKYRSATTKTDPLSSMNAPKFSLSINGVTSITDAQANSLAEGLTSLNLGGLENLTEKQAKILSKIKFIYVAYDFQGLVDRYQKEGKSKD